MNKLGTFLLGLKDKASSLSFSLRHRSALDLFVRNADAGQNAADLFKGEWIAAFPPTSGIRAGDRPLYEDPRLVWMLGVSDVAGRRVLELGPMEGSHTYQLLKAGATSVTSIESNGKSYLKCLVAKEALGLASARFLCADFIAWMEQSTERFDLCLASGVLYHMTDPLKMIGLACARADAVYVWTHYYDESLIRSNAAQAHRFGASADLEWGGFRARGIHRSYGAQAWNPLHLGGEAPYSYWLTRDDILSAFRFHGFTDIAIGPEDLRHPAGPAFCLLARRA